MREQEPKMFDNSANLGLHLLQLKSSTVGGGELEIKVVLQNLIFRSGRKISFPTSVTRLRDLLDFEQLFKAFGNN